MGILDDLKKIGAQALADGLKSAGQGFKDLADAAAQDLKEVTGEPRKAKPVKVKVEVNNHKKEQ